MGWELGVLLAVGALSLSRRDTQNSEPFMPRAALAVWNDYVSLLQSNFHDPDIEALKLPLVACAAHNLHQAAPIWPVIIGPPSTGKTELGILPLRSLPITEMISDINPKAFLAGKGDKSGSLLRDTGSSGIWLFKDLTTILSKREADMKEVFAYLREVYDGALSRRVGGKKLPMWEGKVTIIAACTPYIDRAWNFVNELGDRFVFIRWRRGDGLHQARCAMSRLGGRNGLRSELSTLVKELVHDRIRKVPPLPSIQIREQLAYLAELCALLRRRVVRDNPEGKRAIIEVPEAEGTGRLAESMLQLVAFHAALFDRDEATQDDLALPIRVAIDTIPAGRYKFLSAMDLDGDTEPNEIRRTTGMPKSTVSWIAEELAAQGVIEKHGDIDDDCAIVTYCISNEIRDLWKRALAPTTSSSTNVVEMKRAF